MPSHFPFDEAKATQAAARFVEKSGGSLSHLALMKMLYIVDREALQRWSRPVIGGKYSSLEHGPIISPVLDLMRRIEDLDASTYWTEHLTKDGNEMHLIRNPGDDELSDREIQLIDEVCERYRGFTKWQLRDLTHTFEEWTDPGTSSIPISVQEVLYATGKRGAQIAKVMKELDALASVDDILGAYPGN